MTFLFSFLLCATAAVPPDSIPYHLEQPAQIYLLNDERLRELSGISMTKQEGVLAGIADERGEVYMIDLKQEGKITEVITFKDKGDFEDVQMVGQCIYVIKSDGQVYEIGCWQGRKKPNTEVYKTGLGKASDVEGLCYDPLRRCLLLASKGDPKNDSLRYVWAFDLHEKELLEEPVFSINPHEINRLVPYGEHEKKDFFSPSAIAVHPLTGDIYVISTALKRLAILDGKTGKIKTAVALDKKHLPQPEGIAFDAQGRLYISSEGKDAEGRILCFDPVKKGQ